MEVFDVVSVDEGGQCYAVIAARSNARWWLIPLGNSRAAAAGLEMLQPISLPAKIAKIMALIITKFGSQCLLGKGILRLSGLPNLGETFSGRMAYMSFFTGTDGPHRKTTMQFMDSGGVILGYCKMSRKSHIRPYLRNEADMLAHVAAIGLRSANIPSVLAYRDDAAITLLVTDSLKSNNYIVPRILGTDHIAFLVELKMHTEYVGSGRLLDNLAAQRQDIEGRFSAQVGPKWLARLVRVEKKLRPYVDKIPLCLCHGDFTPWNTFIQGNRLYVFDWEYARVDWPVGFDFIHFSLATIPLAQQERELPGLLKKLVSTQLLSDEKAAQIAMLLSLYCHALFYICRLMVSQRSIIQWHEGPTRAALIDKLLKLEGLDT